MKKVYLAGPDVFFPQASEHFDKLEAACLKFGLQGVRPSDGDLSAHPAAFTSGAEAARGVYLANVALIRSCDAVLANLQPFRNDFEPDSGTAFEVGFASALGLPVVSLVPSLRPVEERVIQACGLSYRTAQGAGYDARFGMLIEEFGQPLNLMLSCSTAVYDQMEDALAHLASTLASR